VDQTKLNNTLAANQQNGGVSTHDGGGERERARGRTEEKTVEREMAEKHYKREKEEL